jgi:hypothetical protein
MKREEQQTTFISPEFVSPDERKRRLSKQAQADYRAGWDAAMKYVREELRSEGGLERLTKTAKAGGR